MEIGTNDVLTNEFGLRRFESTNSNRSELGQEDFLQLIVAQVQNQDPFEPTDNGAFISDLASFSSLDSINNLSSSFETFANNFNNSQVFNAASLIGQSVVVESNQFIHSEGEPTEAFIDAGGQIGIATVQISNASGEVVRSIDVPLSNPNLNSFNFDGLDASGNPVPEGNYFLNASLPLEDSELALVTQVNSRIQSVNLASGNSGSIQLGLATGESILLDDVTQISQ